MPTLPTKGQRVRFKQDYWFDPMQVITVGMTGHVASITERQGSPVIAVTMDQPHEGLAADGNTMSFYPECGPLQDEDGKDIVDIAEQFAYFCEVTD